MNHSSTNQLGTIARWACLGFALALIAGAGAAFAYPQYLSDGAVQNQYGGFDLPLQGSCPVDLTQPTRPDCIALRFPAFVDQATCQALVGGVQVRSWTSSYCNDLVHNADQTTCESYPDRKWSNGICSIVMLDDDRNNVACALHGGTWGPTSTCVGNWIMPAGDAYDPPVLNWSGTGSAGTGDQCLRCHNTRTQYNGPRVRDTEDTMFMGHRNMSRKVDQSGWNYPWGGPPFECIGAFGTAEEECYDNGGNWVPVEPYPGTDTGQDFDWATGTIDEDFNPATPNVPVYWIYGDWLSALPRAIYAAGSNTSGASIGKPKMSYSCARCHTTGWSSDATINYGAGVDSASATREPEASFPGVTWDGVTLNTYGKVNLAGGVSGDTNKFASWDQFGIQCSRCHGAAIERTGTAEYGFGAAAGMATHHSDMTGPTVGTGGDKGYCTNPNFGTLSACTANGGDWLTQCSIAGVCSDLTYTTSGSCQANGKIWTSYNSSALCTGGGGTWGASGSCNLAGVCNTLNPAHNTQALCEGAGGQWAAATDIVRCVDIHEYGVEHNIAAYAAAAYTGNKTNRGQVITNLCMNCHRQETSGLPTDANNPAGALKVGPYHGTVTFVSHPHGNQYLNSPHAKFTGKFSEIATGNNANGKYTSHFMTEGEALNTGNGCTGCHDVHTSTVTGERPFREECTECHAKALSTMRHPATPGTPLDVPVAEEFEACVTCHMPGGEHLFRINADETYSTFPMPAAINGTVNANTAPAGTYGNAVWVDLDQACGQCHGGGTEFAQTTGQINAGSPTLTVTSTTGFAANERVKIVGAGALYYDETGTSKLNEDFETYVKSVDSATQITLAGNATKAVSNAAVVQNPTKNGANYISKARLAPLAKGIHGDAAIAKFSAVLGNPQTLTVYVNAAASVCADGCDRYSWNWGDGSSNGSGVSASHTYATAGKQTITLTVTDYSHAAGIATKQINTYSPDLPPTIPSNPCDFDADTWQMDVRLDIASDDKGVKQQVINWGDGSLVSNNLPPFDALETVSHLYTKVGSFAVKLTVVDTIGQGASYTCLANVQYLSISGTVTKSDGSTPLYSAKIQAWKGGTLVKTVYSLADGTFSVGNLKPGTYDLIVTKTGYSFDTVSGIVVGPSSVGNLIQAVTP